MTKQVLAPVLFALAAFAGLLVSSLLGHITPLSNLSLVLFIWLFFTGLLAKHMIQGLIRPFMNIRDHNPNIATETRVLNLLRTLTLCIGLGFGMGDIIFKSAIGTISIGLLILGASIHLGTHHINRRAWFYQ